MNISSKFCFINSLKVAYKNECLINLKSNFHTTTFCLWRYPRNKRMFFEKEKKHSKRFPTEYTSTTKIKDFPFKQSCLSGEFETYRFKYPDFLPEPDIKYRQPLKEKIQREEMIKRRKVIHIPEFYVGSYLAVTVSDFWNVEKVSKFIGICIAREGQGLKSTFTLRNIIENEGVEIKYDLYNPTIRSIEVLKLEKRLDDHLFYLRDAPHEYSFVPFDFKAEIKLSGSNQIPINKIKVKLNDYPWHRNWYLHDLKGVQDLEGIPKDVYERKIRNLDKLTSYDLVENHRLHITEEEQLEIWTEIKENSSEFCRKKEISLSNVNLKKK